MAKFIQKIINEIIDQYMYADETNRPWIIGFSGGKDSTVMLQLVWKAIEQIKELTGIAKKGFENTVQSKIAMKSFSNLQSAINYTEIDIELYELLNKKEEREIIKYAVLDKYFPNLENLNWHRNNIFK